MKIAIAGYGIEGESNYRYYSADPNNQITIVDEREPKASVPSGAKLIAHAGVFDDMNGYDLVVRTASLPPRRIKTDGKIWSATNEFFDKCPATIIGVTGSKGKGTTASLIASILWKAGKKVWLIGNIGSPALDVLTDVKPDDIVVYELSSFQLWDIKKSPHIAVVLFIEQEHLDVHTDMEEYVGAKANIARYQTIGDYIVFNKDNQYSTSIANSSKAIKVGYVSDDSAHVCDENFYYNEQKICSVNALQLAGIHNIDNACAAIDAVWPIVNDISVIEQGLAAFEGLPHRLQFVREVDDVRYYDDSIATTPSSAIAALRTFNGPKVIILGGSSKGSDYSELGRELSRQDVKALLIGDEAAVIAEACEVAGFTDYKVINFTNMDELVASAKLLSNSGGVVLLSPASASFGLFKDYADRGNQFDQAVGRL